MQAEKIIFLTVNFFCLKITFKLDSNWNFTLRQQRILHADAGAMNTSRHVNVFALGKILSAKMRKFTVLSAFKVILIFHCYFESRLVITAQIICLL